MLVRRNLLRYFYVLVLILIVGGLTVGCGSIQRTEHITLPAGLPTAVELKAVPFYPQSEYQCGPSSLAMALTYSELPITPEAIQGQVYTPSRKGSLQMDMVGATRRKGRVAYPINGLDSIWPELAVGHPVIVLQNLGLSWIPVWHYALVIGYDFAEDEIILRSGITERKTMSFHTFEKTWARGDYWGIIVLKPTQLPAVAKEHEYLAAVFGLEKARQFQAAVRGYQTALGQWPDSLVGYMGLGNSHYALGDLHRAEASFRMATVNHPQAAGAYNNLAQVLLELGRMQEALEAARKAVAIGGPMSDVYESTLKEILSKNNDNS